MNPMKKTKTLIVTETVRYEFEVPASMPEDETELKRFFGQQPDPWTGADFAAVTERDFLVQTPRKSMVWSQFTPCERSLRFPLHPAAPSLRIVLGWRGAAEAHPVLRKLFLRRNWPSQASPRKINAPTRLVSPSSEEDFWNSSTIFFKRE
jgi:hypothetical protein